MTAPLVSTTDRPYQLLPPLTVEQRDLLRQSIKENGVLEPVVFDEDGEILDGHHRVEIAEELGIEYPRRVIDDLDRPGKHMYALTVNVARRQLDQNARGSLVAQMRIRGMSIRRIAETLGVSYGTVRNDLAQVSKTAHLPEEITGTDGKSYAATRPTPAPAPDLTSAIERALASAGHAGMTAWQLAFLIDPAGPDADRAELAVRMAPILEQLAAEGRARVVGEVDGGQLWAFADPSWPTEDELKPWGTLAPPAARVAELMERIADDPRDRTHGAEFESYDAAEPEPERHLRAVPDAEQVARNQREADRLRLVSAGQRAARTLVTDVSACISTVVSAIDLGEKHLITEETIAKLRDAVDLLASRLEASK